MNPSSIVLLIVALLMASAGGDVERLDVIVDGAHDATESRHAIIVVDGLLEIADGSQLEGPLYVVGGQVTVSGSVAGDLVQLAGNVEIDGSGRIGGELRHIAGNLDVAAGAQIADRVTFDTSARSDGVGSLTSTLIGAGLIAVIGFLVVRRRPEPVSNISAAAIDHPVVTFTVGALIMVTFLAVFVFMAFTLVLLPVAVLGVAVGLMLAILGLVALGNVVGRRLPIRDRAVAAAVGAAVVIVSMQLVGTIPLVGDWLALIAILVGMGAVIVTYIGATRFEVERLPGLAPAHRRSTDDQ